MKKARGKKTYSFPDLPDIPDISIATTTATQQAIGDYYQQMLAQMSTSILPSWTTQAGASVAGKPKTPSIDRAKLELLKDAESYRVTARMPDYVQVITAWRAWDLKHTPDGPRLEALGQSVIWQPKKAIEAVCVPQSRSILPLSSTPAADHAAPNKNCNCGVWAFKELDNLVAAIGCDYKEVKVLGQVSLWGRVIETENGYRAEKAYPSELWLFDSSLEELGMIYDVPVRTVS